MKKRKFTGIYKKEPYIWASLSGIFLVPFFMSVLYKGANVRWEFLTIATVLMVLYHVSHIKYCMVPDLRND